MSGALLSTLGTKSRRTQTGTILPRCALIGEIRVSWERLWSFDIRHNKCRLIATIKYKWKMVYIRHILSHADCNQKDWQE